MNSLPERHIALQFSRLVKLLLLKLTLIRQKVVRQLSGRIYIQKDKNKKIICRLLSIAEHTFFLSQLSSVNILANGQ